MYIFNVVEERVVGGIGIVPTHMGSNMQDKNSYRHHKIHLVISMYCLCRHFFKQYVLVNSLCTILSVGWCS